MEKYLRLFAALERIFGKGYVSRLMGKQSNVITLPDKQARKFLDTELNVMEASEGAVKKGVQDLETVISDTKRLSTLNDQELLTITNNAERLAVKVNPPAPPPAPTAKIIPFTNKPNPEDFATGGRVGMAGGGILKLAMKFFNDNNPVSAYKKYLKYVKETAQKDPAKLAPEVGGIVVGSELIHRGLRRKLKEVKEKNNENDSENLETDNRTEKAGGGVSQGLDYLMGINRTSFQEGGTTEDKELSNPTMTSMVMPSIRGIQNFLSNPVVQGVGSFMLGGLPALGNYAKGQVGGYLAGKAISPMVQARLAAESFRDSTDGPFGGYNDFDGTGGTFSTDSSDTGASSGGVDSAGDGGDGYATGGRVGYAGGSILKTIGKKIIKKTKKPNLKRQLTDDEIDDLSADVGDLDAYLDFDGTVGSADKIRKQHKEYMDYMYYQYKTGRLDPKPGEMNTSRMQYLRNKREQAEMTDDPKLFNPNERDELDNLEETFSESGIQKNIKKETLLLQNLLQNLQNKMIQKDLKKLKR
jgi:hypothetical protein